MQESLQLRVDVMVTGRPEGLKRMLKEQEEAWGCDLSEMPQNQRDGSFD